ncbi:MAG TPA: nuclear transport factor 2 family protein, partial [Streptosporangiaceae bacterium]|nr:nuclear transport factor 2 family protein [Streptosporangiaceae bacterium]
MDLWFRSTVGLRRTAAGWQITHEHESTPFYGDGSDRAATDLDACRAGDCRAVGGILHRHSVRAGPSLR